MRLCCQFSAQLSHPLGSSSASRYDFQGHPVKSDTFLSHLIYSLSDEGKTLTSFLACLRSFISGEVESEHLENWSPRRRTLSHFPRSSIRIFPYC